MAVYRYVNVELDEAKRLADLYGIDLDLRRCREYCEKYIQTLEGISQPSQIQAADEGVHLECFSAYFFIKYGRCFKGGIRETTSKEILAALSKGDLALHQLAINIRDKYVAHSVNDFESHKVRVWLNPEENGRKINNVNIESHYIVGPGLVFYQDMKHLIGRLLSWIGLEKKLEQEKLIKLAGQRYSLEYLYAQNSEAPEDVDISKVSKRRKGL